MKNNDQIILVKRFIVRDPEVEIVSSIPGANPRLFVVRLYANSLVHFIVKESDFKLVNEKDQTIFLGEDFYKEEGSKGTIVHILPNSRYLCEFDHPFCNLVLEEKDFVLFDPPNKFFSLLNTVKLSEDVPEHGLKKGTKGVIIMVYFVPYLAYEVEFYVGEDNDPPYVSYVFEGKQLEFVSEDCNG